jgi:hypothetical protein
MFARFAQEFGGQRLHIVEADANTQTVSRRAICGRDCSKRGNWRYTINMPLANLCRNCGRFARDVRILNF